MKLQALFLSVSITIYKLTCKFTKFIRTTFSQNTSWPISCHWSLLIPLKTSENLWFSDVFRGYQIRSVAWNGLIAASGFLFVP